VKIIRTTSFGHFFKIVLRSRTYPGSPWFYSGIGFFDGIYSEKELRPLTKKEAGR
jgi:hypothetical protein